MSESQYTLFTKLQSFLVAITFQSCLYEPKLMVSSTSQSLRLPCAIFKDYPYTSFSEVHIQREGEHFFYKFE